MKRVALFVLLLVACDDSFIKGWEVDRTRVLGARVEGAEVSWLVARATHSAWAYAACTDTHLNAPRCDSPVIASGSGESDDEVIVMNVGSLAPSSLVLTAFCTRGPVALSPVNFTATCGDGSPALLASVKTPATANANPGAPEIAMDGQPLAADTCVAPGSKHVFGWVFRAEDREAGEAMLMSSTITAGELERQYSSLDANEAAPKEAQVEWTAPASGEARLYLVLRDSRGGTAFTRATICVR